MKTFALCLFFFSMTVLSPFIVPAYESGAPAHSHDAKSHWGDELKSFYEYLDTDTDAARAVLQDFATEVFNNHPLSAEWVAIYFRMSQQGTEKGSEIDVKRVSELVSDMKRLHKLELRILADMDPEKYAKQREANRAALVYYTDLGEMLSRPKSTQGTGVLENHQSEIGVADARRPVSEKTPLPTAAEKKVGEVTGKHFKAFLKLLPIDPKAARVELNAYAARRFSNHPFVEEWKSLCFRIARDEEALTAEIIRFYELEIEMCTDIDPQRFSEQIQEGTKLVNNLKQMAKMLEHQGVLETKKMSFKMQSE